MAGCSSAAAGSFRYIQLHAGARLLRRTFLYSVRCYLFVHLQLQSSGLLRLEATSRSNVTDWPLTPKMLWICIHWYIPNSHWTRSSVRANRSTRVIQIHDNQPINQPVSQPPLPINLHQIVPRSASNESARAYTLFKKWTSELISVNAFTADVSINIDCSSLAGNIAYDRCYNARNDSCQCTKEDAIWLSLFGFIRYGEHLKHT